MIIVLNSGGIYQSTMQFSFQRLTFVHDVILTVTLLIIAADILANTTIVILFSFINFLPANLGREESVE